VRSQPGALIITERALHIAERRAQRSAFRETGGLLLGFRVARDVHVVDVLEIRDPAATRTRFTLLEKRREDVLIKYLTELPLDSPIGYVGTWHSHLADAGPGSISRRSVERSGQQEICSSKWFWRDQLQDGDRTR
jgi:hypothetical protein